MSDNIVSLSDRIKELSHSTGTGNLRLDGAATGFSAFSSAYSYDDALYYGITDLTDYEVGSGQYIQDGGNDAIRRFPIKSSNSNALVSFSAGVKEVYVTYPGKSAVFTASGMGNFQAPQVSGVPFWGSDQILSYDGNVVWSVESSALGVSQPDPQYAIDVGGLESYSAIRASGFITGDSGVMFVVTPTSSGGRQVEPFMRNEIDVSTGTDAVIALSGTVDQRLTFRKQTAGLVFAGPVSGCTPPSTCSPDYPAFRALTESDIPDLSHLYIELSAASGYTAGSGLSLDLLEFNMGNMFYVSDTQASSQWIHQANNLVVSGISGVLTALVTNGTTKTILIDATAISGYNQAYTDAQVASASGSMTSWTAHDGIGGSGAILDTNIFTVSGVSGIDTLYLPGSNLLQISLDPSGHTFKKNNIVTVPLSDIVLVGEQVQNGVSLSSGDRVLLVNQADARENGIWTVGADPYGSWIRPVDFPSSGEASAKWTHQQMGTHYDESVWFCVNDNPCTIDYDDQEWRFFDGGVSVSGWADSTMSSRDAAVSGWADAKITATGIAISGWANAKIAATGAAVSGWADATISNRDTAISGWADTMSSNKDAAISGWAGYTMADIDQTAGTGLQLVGSVFNTAGTGSFTELRFAGNTRVGDYTGDIGTDNVLIGKYAGIDFNNASADRNTLIGYAAGSGMNANDIIAIGEDAGSDSNLGGGSILLGLQTGMGARYLNFGYALGSFSTKDSLNCYGVNAIGYSAFRDSTYVMFGEAIGWEAGKGATHSTGVAILGSYAGDYSSGNCYSSFIGYQAAKSVVDSYELSTLGYYASSYTSVSSGCVAVGSFAGSHSHDMQYSNSIGYLAGSGSVVTEDSNFIGHLAGTDVAEDTRSTFIGTEAGATSSGNVDFIAIGRSAGGNTSGPSYDHVRTISIGFRAGESSSNGLETTCIGTSAGADSHHNYQSSMIGRAAGSSSHSSSGCIMIGRAAGQYSSGCSHSIYMGMFVGYAASGNNQLVIDAGYTSIGTGTWSYANRNDNNIFSIGQTITGDSADKYLRIGATGTLADYSEATLSIKSEATTRATLKLEPITSQTANQLVAVSGAVTDNPIINAAGLLRIPTFPTIVAATGSIGAASSANSGVIVLAGTALIVSDGSSWITV